MQNIPVELFQSFRESCQGIAEIYFRQKSLSIEVVKEFFILAIRHMKYIKGNNPDAIKEEYNFNNYIKYFRFQGPDPLRNYTNAERHIKLIVSDMINAMNCLLNNESSYKFLAIPFIKQLKNEGFTKDSLSHVYTSYLKDVQYILNQ
jgi:hypothetical protein